MQKWITVNDMYKYTQENDMKLLSVYNGDFWAEYLENSDDYDSLFKRLFKNFRYFDQDIDDEALNVEQVTLDFINQVHQHLRVNSKKYAEIFRINNLSNDYKLFDTYSMTENKTGSLNDITNTTLGSRTDNTSSTLGSRSDTSEDQVSAFNDSDYVNANKTVDTKGQEVDTTQYQKGSESDNVSKSQSTLESITKSGRTNGKSSAEIVKEHLEVWDMYEFYNYIFSDIAAALLLI